VGYPTKLLNPNESIVLDLHPHWRIFLAPIGLLLVGLAAVFVVVNVLRPAEPMLDYASGIPVAIALVWFGYRFTVWKTTHFVVTSDRVIYRSGVVSKAGQNIPLERINNVAFSQSILERMLRVGDLTIESAGETGRQIFSDVYNPSAVENRIYAEIEGSKERDEKRAAGHSVSVGDELQKLEQLRRDGVITDAEFQSQKARLLG
jgi:uncharacterized membrane protein YdbT with pleckstrin-like domain